MTGFPISSIFQLKNGNLIETPRYNTEPLPTDNYALVYTQNIGKYGKVNMEAKVITKINGESTFKSIYAHQDTPDPIASLRRKVEADIYKQLSSAPSQKTLSSYMRKNKKSKSKVKRCKCKK
jgi:hypothetical protein